MNGFLLVHASMSFSCLFVLELLYVSRTSFFSSFCVFTCTSSRTERWRFALGKWEWESELLKRKWIESQYDLRLFFFILFLPFAFYLESFFFGTCPLERALVCVWKTVKESISRATSQAIQQTRGGGGMQLYLMVSCFFITLSFPWRIIWRENEREKKKKREMFWVEGGLSCWY